MQVFISEAHGSPMNSGRPTASDLLAAIRGNINTNNTHTQKRSRVQKLQPVLVSSREPPQESHRGDDVLQLTKTKSKNKTVVFSEEKKYSDETKEGTEIPLIPLVSPPKAVKGILVRRKKDSSISFAVTQNSPERSMSPNERQDDDSMSQDKTPVNQHNQDSQSKPSGKTNFSPATNAPSKLSEFFKRNQTISERPSKLPTGFTQATKINSVRLHSLTTDSSPQTNSNMLKKENSDANQELSFPSLVAFVPNLKDDKKGLLRPREGNYSMINPVIQGDGTLPRSNNINFPKLTDQFKSSVYHFYGGHKRKERHHRRDISFTADTSSLIEQTDQEGIEVPGARLVSKTVLGPLRKMDDSFLHSKGLNNTDRERDGILDESITKYKTREAIFPGKNIIQPLKSEDQPKIINSHKINPIINSKGHKGLSSRSWGPALSTFDKFKNDHIDGHRNKIDDFKTFTCYIGKQNIRYDIEKNMYKTYSLVDSINTGRNTYCEFEEDLVLICGGVNQKSFSVASSAYMFNSITETVEKLPDMLMARYQHSIVYHDKKAYILGGQGEGNEVLKNCCVLHIEEKIWFRIPSMNLERKNLSSFKSYKTGCIYVIGGIDNAGCLVVTGEKFDPKRLTWTNFSINPNPDFNLKEVIVLGNFITGEGSKMVEQVLILSKERSPSLESLSYKLFSFDPELEMLRKKMEFNFTTKEPVSFGVYKQRKIYLFRKSASAIADVYNLANEEWETQEFVTK